jgi:hypothetical protein
MNSMVTEVMLINSFIILLIILDEIFKIRSTKSNNFEPS